MNRRTLLVNLLLSPILVMAKLSSEELKPIYNCNWVCYFCKRMCVIKTYYGRHNTCRSKPEEVQYLLSRIEKQDSPDNMR